MMGRKLAAALTAAMLLLAGCGQGGTGDGSPPITAEDQNGGGSGEAAAPEPDEQGDAAQQEEGASGTADKQEDQAAGEDAASPSGSNGPDTQDKAADPPAPLYRMNAAYRFVPIDPDAASSQVVLLTFDDGPKERGMLESMLDTLDKHGAKAVFFINGYRASAQPELLELIHERGQTIGNHSWDHIDLKKEDETVVRKQIGDVQTIVSDTIGSAPKLFRPPFGSGGDKVRRIAEEYGLLYMTWSNGSLDWDASTKDKPDAVIQNVMDQLHPGANILMHELPWTDQALDKLLSSLEAEGYGFIDPARIETPGISGSEA